MESDSVRMTGLIRDVDVIGTRGDLASADIRSVELDSRLVGPGALFCCVPGATTDGHDYASAAVAHGATALLCEHFVDVPGAVAQVCVAPGRVRPTMAKVASTFFGDPWRSLTMIGVTGTNGKTTTTQLIRSILDYAGGRSRVIGTLDGQRTTPEAPELQRRLAEFRQEGADSVAMEVSSHALTQHRVEGIIFDVAAFTNLSRDHLDYHGSMEEYFEAKTRLFEPSAAKLAVVDTDGQWGRRLAEMIAAAGGTVVPVSRSDATEVSLGAGWSSFRWRGTTVEMALSGAFNVDNALVAAAVCSGLGLDDAHVAEGLGAAQVVPGRMEIVEGDAPFAVVVDYAHTPAGLEAALSSARALAGTARVLCVFGCGGDRDRGKRPAMGAAAVAGADVVVLTSDNPRSEDPGAIIDEVRAGMAAASAGTELVVEPDRAQAISLAVGRARPGDVVLIAGKGHETTQVSHGSVVAFDDRVEAARALAHDAGRAGPGR